MNTLDEMNCCSGTILNQVSYSRAEGRVYLKHRVRTDVPNHHAQTDMAERLNLISLSYGGKLIKFPISNY